MTTALKLVQNMVNVKIVLPNRNICAKTPNESVTCSLTRANLWHVVMFAEFGQICVQLFHSLFVSL